MPKASWDKQHFTNRSRFCFPSCWRFCAAGPQADNWAVFVAFSICEVALVTRSIWFDHKAMVMPCGARSRPRCPGKEIPRSTVLLMELSINCIQDSADISLWGVKSPARTPRQTALCDSCVLKCLTGRTECSGSPWALASCFKRKDLLNQTFRECAQILHGSFYLGRQGLQLYHCYTTPVQLVATGWCNYQMTRFNASLSAQSKSCSEGFLWAIRKCGFADFRFCFTGKLTQIFKGQLQMTSSSYSEPLLVKTLVLLFTGCMGDMVRCEFNSVFINISSNVYSELAWFWKRA